MLSGLKQNQIVKIYTSLLTPQVGKKLQTMSFYGLEFDQQGNLQEEDSRPLSAKYL